MDVCLYIVDKSRWVSEFVPAAGTMGAMPLEFSCLSPGLEGLGKPGKSAL